MFEIKVLVETKKLGDVLEALDGIVVMSSIGITPVRNAKVIAQKGNIRKVVERHPSNGAPMYMQVFEKLVESGNFYPTNRTVAAMLKDLGGAPTSSSAALASLIKNGYARKKGPGEYALIVRPQSPQNGAMA